MYGFKWFLHWIKQCCTCTELLIVCNGNLWPRYDQTILIWVRLLWLHSPHNSYRPISPMLHSQRLDGLLWLLVASLTKRRHHKTEDLLFFCYEDTFSKNINELYCLRIKSVLQWDIALLYISFGCKRVVGHNNAN